MSMFGKGSRNDGVAVAPPPAMTAPAHAPAPAPVAPPSNGHAAAPAAPPAATESVFGPTLVFKGEINFQDAIRIEGEIHGRIMGEGRVTVTERGKVFGDIIAAQIIVLGLVQGNVTAADRLEVAASGQVAGDLKGSRLVIADGAKLIGKLDIGSESMTFDPPAKSGAAEPADSKDALAKIL
jgi:cytoskeletal protein CcmA (bactofilin family)